LTNSQSLIDLSLSAYRWFEDGMLGRLKDAGWSEITRAHSRVFTSIDRGGTRSSELARRLGVTRQAAHQTIQELVDLGFLQLAPDPTSRRAKRVVLTPRGKRVVADAREIFRELEATLARRIGRKRVARLRRAFESDWGEPVGQPRAARHEPATSG
jgi:DNA-binding MarR family transcriptional regulator